MFSAKPNDPRAILADQDFITEFTTIGPAAMARKHRSDISNIYSRRRTLEKLYLRQICAPAGRGGFRTRQGIEHAARLHFDIQNGIALIGSDAHIWPGPKTAAMRAFIKFARELKPKVCIMNGDVVDLPQVSRHPPIGWERHPTVADEIDAAQEILTLIEDAVPRNCKLAWTLGNHDGRFETRLATEVPEYARLHGFHLKDYFPAWQACWSSWINNDVVVKHRFKNGVHATHNNAVYSGKTMVTGHLHSQRITPFTDYNGDRYGVDTGCLADPEAQAFLDYTEDNPKNWRAGFAVLKFHDGKLLPPELVTMWSKNHVTFRGEVIKV